MMAELATVNVHEAKTHLSQLLARAEGGEEIIISRAGKPIAKIIPILPSKPRRVPGIWKGKVWIADDFNETPEEVIDSFYESEVSPLGDKKDARDSR